MNKKILILIAVIAIVAILGGILLFSFLGNDKYSAEFADGSKLTWEELKEGKDSDKLHYIASCITDDEIKDGAFRNSTLVSIKIPETVKIIGSHAFAGSYDLKEIKLEGENENYELKDGVLYDIKNKAVMLAPAKMAFVNGEYTVPAGTVQIYANAFYGCEGLVNIALNDELESIGANAFTGTSIKNFRINANLKSIHSTSLSGMKTLTWIFVHENNKNFYSDAGVLYDAYKTTLLTFPAGRDNVTSYKVPEGTVIISKEAFRDVQKVIIINLPKTIKVIEDNAFLGMDHLKGLFGDTTKVAIRYDGTKTQWDALNISENNANLFNGKISILCTGK